MIRTEFSHSVEIPASLRLVLSVISDVERWPEWTASISRVKRLSPGPLQVGSRVRIHQPKFPPAVWRVTELNRGVGFTWVSRAPGVRVTARHSAALGGIGSRVTLSIRYEGWLGLVLARCTRRLNELYLAIEAEGLKARCAQLAARPYSPSHEAH